MRARSIVLGWLALVGPAAAAAQTVEVGERIRVRTTDGERVTATLVGITPMSLQLRDDDVERRIMRESVSTLERSLGERRSLRRNFLITTAAGALALGTVSLAMDDDTCNDEPFGCLDPGGAFLIGAIVGGIVSAPIGLLVGLSVRGERWEPVSLPVDTAPAPSSFGGARVVFALSLGAR